MSALAATGEICPFTLILRSSATRTSHEPMRFILIRLCEANGSDVRGQAPLLPGGGGVEVLLGLDPQALSYADSPGRHAAMTVDRSSRRLKWTDHLTASVVFPL